MSVEGGGAQPLLHAHAGSPEPDAMGHGLEIPPPPPPRRGAQTEPSCSANEPLLCSPRSLPFPIPSWQQPGGGGHLPSPHHHHHHHHHHPGAMELFPDGGFVRLQSRVNGKFVHADADWERVFLRPNMDIPVIPSLNAVWRVQHWVSPDQGDTYVLLQNAAYGRYLSFSLRKAQRGHHGRRATQLDRTEPHVLNAYPWMWRVERLNPPDQDFVSLRYLTCYLRANGRYLPWNNRVTADVEPYGPRINTMMHWTVHQVAASPAPSPQPLPLTVEVQGSEMFIQFPQPPRRIRDMSIQFPQPPRTIRHVRASDEGEFDQNHHNWPSFPFYGTSVIELKNELRRLQDWNENMSAYTLCMRPGSHGRPMPLLIGCLPSSIDSMNIVVFRTGSPGAAALVYPVPAAAVAPDPAAAAV